MGDRLWQCLQNVLHPFLGQLTEIERFEELVERGTGEKVLFEVFENVRTRLHDDRIFVAKEVGQLLIIGLTRTRVHVLEERERDLQRWRRGVKTNRFEQVDEEGVDQTEEDHRCFVGRERFQCFRSGPTSREWVKRVMRMRRETDLVRSAGGWTDRRWAVRRSFCRAMILYLSQSVGFIRSRARVVRKNGPSTSRGSLAVSSGRVRKCCKSFSSRSTCRLLSR